MPVTLSSRSTCCEPCVTASSCPRSLQRLRAERMIRSPVESMNSRLLKVEHHHRLGRQLRHPRRALQQRRAGHVEFAVEREHDPVILLRRHRSEGDPVPPFRRILAQTAACQRAITWHVDVSRNLTAAGRAAPCRRAVVPPRASQARSARSARAGPPRLSPGACCAQLRAGPARRAAARTRQPRARRRCRAAASRRDAARRSTSLIFDPVEHPQQRARAPICRDSPPASMSTGRRMAGERDGQPRVASPRFDRDQAGGAHVGAGRLRRSASCSVSSMPVGRLPEHRRGAQRVARKRRHAGRPRALAADVADRQQPAACAVGADVVEVAADVVELAGRAVERPRLHARYLGQRLGQQRGLQDVGDRACARCTGERSPPPCPLAGRGARRAPGRASSSRRWDSEVIERDGPERSRRCGQRHDDHGRAPISRSSSRCVVVAGRRRRAARGCDVGVAARLVPLRITSATPAGSSSDGR